MSLIDSISTFVSEKRVGFTMDEIMTGTHEFVEGKGPAGTHPMEFRVTWGHKSLPKWINPLGGDFMLSDLKGKVDVGGLAVDADCEGSLALRYVQDQTICYTFEFEDDAGKHYRYVGEKRDLRPWNLHRTHTTCYGEITDLDTDEVISRGTLYFRFSTLPGFLLSFKLA